MAKKTIYEVREQLETVLREVLKGVEGRNDGAVSRRGHTRAVVTVNAYNGIDVLLVSDVFEGLAFEERTNVIWPAVESRMAESELDRVERWELLTFDEARSVYPSTLKPRSPVVTVP